VAVGKPGERDEEGFSKKDDVTSGKQFLTVLAFG